MFILQDIRLGIKGIIFIVSGGNLLKNGADIGTETMGLLPLDHDNITRFIDLFPITQVNKQLTGQDLKGFFFLFMVMAGMTLPRQQDYQLLTIFSVNAVNNGSAALMEFIYAIMV